MRSQGFKTKPSHSREMGIYFNKPSLARAFNMTHNIPFRIHASLFLLEDCQNFKILDFDSYQGS